MSYLRPSFRPLSATLNLNDPLLAYDPAEVTAPTGEIMVTSRAGHSITNSRVENNGYLHLRWRIRKVGDLRAVEETK